MAQAGPKQQFDNSRLRLEKVAMMELTGQQLAIFVALSSPVQAGRKLTRRALMGYQSCLQPCVAMRCMRPHVGTRLANCAA